MYYFTIVLIMQVTWVILLKLFHLLLETTEFNPQIDDIIEEAFERTGVSGSSNWLSIKICKTFFKYFISRMGKQRCSFMES